MIPGAAEKYASSGRTKKIDRFNSFFRTVKKDDTILLDYLPARGTVVTISGQEMGAIDGKDFNDALLKIWLGPKPINKGLKAKLLNPQL